MALTFSIDQTPRHLLVRQDTPMPRKEITPTDGFAPPITVDRDILSQSPDTLINQIDDAIQDTLSTRKIRPASNESMLFCTNDFGMNDLMVIIRGMATTSEQNTTIRTEISHLFKDNQTRLDQLEKVKKVDCGACIYLFIYRNWIVLCLKQCKFIINNKRKKNIYFYFK